MRMTSDRVVQMARRHLVSLAVCWKHPRISQLEIAFNSSLSSTLARWMPPGDVLEISAAAKARGARLIREIVAHEAAHVAVWDRSGGSARPHGREWAALMRAAGFEARATLIRCGYRRSTDRRVRIRHFCSICHFTKLAKRRMPRWRCPECRAIGLEGTLKTERVPEH
jgi:predicted SprT family Zn-dependent metalloprotease